jgi:dolichol-phosphate mannosyltransferase
VCVNDGVRASVLAQGALTGLVLSRLARGRDRRPPLAAGPRAPGTVSVVVPARDEAHRITPLLEALRNDPDVHEVLVVDDHSTDGTAGVARTLGARVLPAPALPEGWVGKPWALQHGLEHAVGDVVLTLDADVGPSPGSSARWPRRWRSGPSGRC